MLLPVERLGQSAAGRAYKYVTVGRNIRENWIDDHYGGIHSDTFNMQGDAAITIRATGEYKGKPINFDNEDAATLSRMRALRACLEAAR